ncbi:hypothetical protein ACTQ49_00010 [Luteococcus sp. Sow4_B9]|uniref:hypothetical protein n=1 Tax=Luteococcus sp. Sow4_B9 TaxID=3438792 RepID=UPI003F9B0B95
MNFDELPEDWPALSLDDDALAAGVIDLFLRVRDRDRGALLALVTDDELRLLQPLQVDNLPVGCDAFEQHQTVNAIVAAAREAAPGCGLALAIGRRGMVVQAHWDRQWRSALRLACEEQGVVDLGCYLATPTGIVRLDDEDAAAA